MVSEPSDSHDLSASRHDEALSMLIGACRLLGYTNASTVRSVTILTGRRLTGAELLTLHDQAAAWGVSIAMDGGGAVKLRRSPTLTLVDRTATSGRRWPSRIWRKRRTPTSDKLEGGAHRARFT